MGVFTACNFITLCQLVHKVMKHVETGLSCKKTALALFPCLCIIKLSLELISYTYGCTISSL